MILSLKSKLFEYEHPSANTTDDNYHSNASKHQQHELKVLLDEKSNEVALLHEQLTKRDKLVEKQKIELDSMSNDIVNKKRSEVSFLMNFIDLLS